MFAFYGVWIQSSSCYKIERVEALVISASCILELCSSTLPWYPQGPASSPAFPVSCSLKSSSHQSRGQGVKGKGGGRLDLHCSLLYWKFPGFQPVTRKTIAYVQQQGDGCQENLVVTSIVWLMVYRRCFYLKSMLSGREPHRCFLC